jgi:AGZA family xanthine/uracil permease-like MFS transporter
LTAVVVGILFFLAAFFTPIIQMIGGGYIISNAQQYSLFVGAGAQIPTGNFYMYPITAGTLIVVGFFMMSIVREIAWDNFEAAFPAFLVIVGIPLTYNISYGIGFGFICYTVIKTINGKFGEVHPFLYAVSVGFLFVFILPYL